jgi:hypothetical protein
MKRLPTLLVVGLLALAACSSDTLDDVTSEIQDSSDISVADEAEQDAMELAVEVEEQMNTLAAEVQESEAASDLETAWNEVQTELTAAIATMDTDGAIETDGIEGELDDFQNALEAAGDDISPELRDAWDALRSDIQALMS